METYEKIDKLRNVLDFLVDTLSNKKIITREEAKRFHEALDRATE